ncbi:MAG TPA: hypothetical protein VFC19_02145 [Candidatus Limnocylindrales bacterium]|nr:hypothetical protein [Candidatus Limnocylindrales bacterium]
MSDLTTEGYEATPAEIEGMVRNLCAYALSEPDPVQRYVGLTHQQVLFEGMVEAIRRERGRVLADLVVSGVPEAEVAASTSLGTVVKVRKLISGAGETKRVQEAAAARKAAERQAAAADKVAAKKPAPPPEPAPLPPHLAAPTGKRLLTAADRAALGLPVEGTPAGKRPVTPANRPAPGQPVEAAPTRKRLAAPADHPTPGQPVAAATTGERLVTPADRAALGLPVETAPSGKRAVTPADRVALGLGVEGAPRRRGRKAAQKAAQKTQPSAG